jgi:hypothetical protein
MVAPISVLYYVAGSGFSARHSVMPYKVSGAMSWLRVLELIAAEREVVVAAVLRRIGDELPSYKALPPDVLDRHVRVSLEQTVDSARAGRAAVDERQVAELAEVGEVQARHGVPVEDMLRVCDLDAHPRSTVRALSQASRGSPSLVGRRHGHLGARASQRRDRDRPQRP